jgi:hypothetical protein
VAIVVISGESFSCHTALARGLRNLSGGMGAGSYTRESGSGALIVTSSDVNGHREGKKQQLTDSIHQGCNGSYAVMQVYRQKDSLGSTWFNLDRVILSQVSQICTLRHGVCTHSGTCEWERTNGDVSCGNFTLVPASNGKHQTLVVTYIYAVWVYMYVHF